MSTKWLIVVALALTGCNRAAQGLTAEDRRFVDAVVALRHAAQAAGGDTDRFTELKAGVLAERAVTEAELQAYLQKHARNLDHLAAVWETINVQLSVAEER